MQNYAPLDFTYFVSGQLGTFSAVALNFRSPQWWPWSARRDGIAHSACQEARRYRLRGPWNERPRHLTASSEHHFETGYGPSETIGSAVVARPSGNPKGRPIGSQKTMLCGRRSETIVRGR